MVLSKWKIDKGKITQLLYVTIHSEIVLLMIVSFTKNIFYAGIPCNFLQIESIKSWTKVAVILPYHVHVKPLHYKIPPDPTSSAWELSKSSMAFMEGFWDECLTKVERCVCKNDYFCVANLEDTHEHGRGLGWKTIIKAEFPVEVPFPYKLISLVDMVQSMSKRN